MLFISLILATLFAVIVETEATCYDTGGSIHDNFVPCNAAAEVSVCCGRNDYCLDNGLCLDAGGDNIFTVQGCTSQTWEAPCKQYCPGLPPTTNWYQDLTLCKTNDRESGEYCCGQDASCCNDTASYITIPLFSSVYRGMDVASATTSMLTSSSSSPSPDKSSSSSKSTSDKSLALGLGLGLGLGFGLGLLALALAFVGWELRKKNAASNMRASTEASQYQQWPKYYQGPLPELDPNTMKRELQGDTVFTS